MSTPDDNQNQGQQQSVDLAAELRELGQQIEQAIRTALASERAKQLQADVANGMKEIGTQVQQAVKAIQENPRMQDLADRGQHAVDRARESKAAHDLQEALARGIAQLNDQLSNFVQRLRTEDAAAGSTPSEPTTPSTGETTRLDPDNQ